MSKNIILIGAGGHAKVVYESGVCIGYVDDNTVEFYGLEKINESDLANYKDIADLIISFGAVEPKSLLRRRQVFSDYQNLGFSFATVINPKAYASNAAKIEAGTFVAASATLNPDCRIGNNVIINTGAIIEHDAVIGHSSHIAPGAIILGGAIVGENCLVGAGAVVLQNAVVPDNYLVPANSRFPK